MRTIVNLLLFHVQISTAHVVNFGSLSLMSTWKCVSLHLVDIRLKVRKFSLAWGIVNILLAKEYLILPSFQFSFHSDLVHALVMPIAGFRMLLGCGFFFIFTPPSICLTGIFFGLFAWQSYVPLKSQRNGFQAKFLIWLGIVELNFTSIQNEWMVYAVAENSNAIFNYLPMSKKHYSFCWV